jgi:class 3 adenylate cyclase
MQQFAELDHALTRQRCAREPAPCSDLKDIGVLLGHRRKMLAAISELSGAIPGTTEAAAEAQPKIQDSAERRQVTVMFSDLVGSTALSGILSRLFRNVHHHCF